MFGIKMEPGADDLPIAVGFWECEINCKINDIKPVL